MTRQGLYAPVCSRVCVLSRVREGSGNEHVPAASGPGSAAEHCIAVMHTSLELVPANEELKILELRAVTVSKQHFQVRGLWRWSLKWRGHTLLSTTSCCPVHHDILTNLHMPFADTGLVPVLAVMVRSLTLMAAVWLAQASGQAGPEFKATSITKIQGGDDLQNAWRYLLKWERLNAGPEWVSWLLLLELPAPPAVCTLVWGGQC